MQLLLDVDTGVDDAMAILLATRTPGVTVLGVTCVAGNCGLDAVVQNTLKVLDIAGAPDIPVAAGMTVPLVEPPNFGTSIHGADGMGDLGLPPSSRRPDPRHAVEFLRQTLQAATEPVTLVTLAPLTNIAVLLTQYPEVKARIGQVMVMGGAAFCGGNATAAAEFNVRHDPEAADIVFRSGLPLTMYGLDVFLQVTFTRAEAEQMAASTSPAEQLAGRLLQFSMTRFETDRETIGDAGAVAGVIQPDGLTTRHLPVMVELGGTWTRGLTLVDQRGPRQSRRNNRWHPMVEPNVHVAVAVDVQTYRQIFWNALK